MAIHPSLSPGASWSPRPRPRPEPRRQENATLSPQQAIEISSWSEQAAQSLQNLHLSGARNNQDGPASPTPVRHASPALVIPLDEDVENAPIPLRLKSARIEAVEAQVQETARVVYRRREPVRPDNLKRREELLKGKEGSRRRQRWENDRLLNNPWAQPPSSADWKIEPTYTRHNTVPYYLAPLWDAHYAAKEQTRLSRRKGHARPETNGTTVADMHPIPKELRARLKRTRAAKGLLQDLEEDIRTFVEKWNEKQMTGSTKREEDKREVDDDSDCGSDCGSGSGSDDDEDEVVFVGRKHAKSSTEAANPTADATGVDDQKLVFESPVEDQSAGFGRWLVHSLASYYGLRTWSVTVGNPARREAYVGIDPIAEKQRQQYLSSVKMTTGHPIRPDDILPRPLWVSI